MYAAWWKRTFHRAKLYQHETYRGYRASKRRYFHGLKIHLMVTSKEPALSLTGGRPVECVLTPGSVSDVGVLKAYAYDLPPGSIVYADKAYND